jgi:cyclopropane fatty-acyl-phospholipid synthase-like methyltransferase
MTLAELFETNRNPDFDRYFTDKGLPYHTYIQYYDKELSKYRKSVKLLEIGVCWGGSLLLWSKYFDKYDITGVDIETKYMYEEGNTSYAEIKKDKNIKLHLEVNSRDKTFADATFKNSLFDVIVEDGDHSVDVQVETFMAYFPKLKKNGVYFIEDVLGHDARKAVEMRIKEHTKDSVNIEMYEGNMGRLDDIILKITHKK